MTTKKSDEESQYATGPGQVGKPVGPEHDASFHVEDYYDPKTGERLATAWDTEAQKAAPAVEPAPPLEETKDVKK